MNISIAYSSRERNGTHWIIDPDGKEIYPATDTVDAERLVNLVNSSYHRGQIDSTIS